MVFGLNSVTFVSCSDCY